MQRLIQKVVIFILIFVLMLCQPGIGQLEIRAITTEDQSTQNSEDTSEEETGKNPMEGEPEEKTEKTTEESTTQSKIPEEGEIGEATTQEQETVTEEEKPTLKEENEPFVIQKEKKNGLLAASGSDVNHNVTMPDMTSHYFTLQKNGTNVSSASGAALKVVRDEKEAEQYIFNHYPNGIRYNFTPSMGPETKVSVHGGKDGTLKLSTVLAGTYNRYGAVLEAAQEGCAVTCAFNLNRTTTAPYAIYTNVGSWYNPETKRTYDIDMKLTITGCIFPSESIRKQLKNQSMVAPYVSFRNDIIGVDAMGTDSLSMRMDFCYAGTSMPVDGLKGIIQFCDIDSQQGVDYGSGFEQVILFNPGSSKIAYNASGIMQNSKGYAFSQVNQNLKSADMNTTVAGLFSGSSAQCTWTLARCEHQDTGGSAAYAAPGGYQIPVGSGADEAKSYYEQSSTGMMAIRADVGLAPLPDTVTKKVYKGSVSGPSSGSDKVLLGLAAGEDTFTWVLNTNVPVPSNLRKARYTDFSLEDKVDALVNVENVRVFAAEADSQGGARTYQDVTGWFVIEKKDQNDGSTFVTVTALESALLNSAFYGKTYHVHLQVRVRSEEELSDHDHSIRDWLQEDNHLAQEISASIVTKGRYGVDNKGMIKVINSSGLNMNQASNPVVTLVPRRIDVMKKDENTGLPVEGVTFGFFGANPDKAILTAVTDSNGIASFVENETQGFYQEETGDGPYTIKELSVPESLKHVWNQKVMQEWIYQIPSIKAISPALYTKSEITDSETLTNHNIETPPERIAVYKKSTDTGAYLKGAGFMLMEWSQEKKEYRDLMELSETTDKEGKPVYQNEKPFINTMDNQGKYKITEIRAPYGCYLTGQEWTFEIGQEEGVEGKDISYHVSGGREIRKGMLIYRNPLQRGVLTIHKTDDDGKDVGGALFEVTAAEDIYAPWSLDEEGYPREGASPLVQKGTLVDQIKTDASGYGNTTKGKELYLGAYKVTEKRGAKDHIKEQTPYDIELSYGQDQTKKLVYATLEANNRKMRPSFAIAKLAGRTRNDKEEAVSFDKDTGRYTDRKIPGIYQAKEKVDYTVTITNTGNTPLHHLIVTDDMSHVREGQEHSLSEYVVAGSARFVVPENGILSTENGKELKVSYENVHKTSVLLSDLDCGDRVVLHYELKLKENAFDAYSLENDVYVRAMYNDNEKDPEDTNYVWVDTKDMIDGDGNSLASDLDLIHTPGRPGTQPVKFADRTEGIQVKDGMVTDGSKVPGVYKEGETVDYTIYIKNTGTASSKDIRIKDEMSQELASVVDFENAAFMVEEGTLKTAGGASISVKKLGNNELLLGYTNEKGKLDDVLKPGDYVELIYRVVILRDAANLYELKNKVLVNSFYYDGNEDREIPQKEDEDRIEIPGSVEAKAAKLADRTTGAVLENGRYEAQAKTAGVYKNNETVTYKITVTNSAKTVLYDLKLYDQMSEELLGALDPKSIHFKEGNYQSASGRTVRSIASEDKVLTLDFLAPGDSVDIFLLADVRKDVGNLFSLKNEVKLTARYRIGNEEEQKAWEEDHGHNWSLRYHSNLEGDDVVTDSETPVNAGKKIEINGNPFSNPKGTFAGWNDRPDGSGISYRPDEIYTMQRKDADLYAQWIPFTDKDSLTVYRLFYESNDNSKRIAGDSENVQPEDYLMGIDENSFIREGYTFKGWNTKADGSGDVYLPGGHLKMPGHDMTLYAVWEKNPTYTLKYYSNNGMDMERQDAQTPCEPGETVLVDGCGFRYINGNEIMHFVQWNTRPDGSGDVFRPGDEMTIFEDRVLYACWAPADTPLFSIIYHGCNGTVQTEAGRESPCVADEKVHIEDNRFEYKGHTFAGWYSLPDGQGKRYEPGEELQMPDHDVHLYATWEKVSSHKLTYHANNGKGLIMEDGQNPGPEIEIDGCLFENGSMTFVGWNSSQDGSGHFYSPGQKIVLEKDTDLYAQWAKTAKRYRLIYDDGEEKGSQEYDSETPAYKDIRVRINPNRFRKEGWIFKEWNTKKDGKGTAYSPGSLLRMPEEDVCLYAIWEENEKEEEDSANQPDSGSENSENQKITENATEDPTLSSCADVVKEKVNALYQEVENQELYKVLAQMESYEAVEETDLMKDEDHIHVPGTPSVVIAKKADQTEGAVLSEGRYKGTKKAGTYAPGEEIDYTITVTNKGTTDLYELLVEDAMDKNLLASVSRKSISITTGEIKSEKGAVVKVQKKDSEEGINTVILDRLNAGDAAVLHVKAVLLQTVSAASGLNNAVKVSAKYQDVGDDGNPSPAQVPETPQMRDEDKINTGAPILCIAKKADRTTGIKMKAGRYQGTRKQGIYAKGDVIRYRITISNTGAAPAYRIKVRETPSERLLSYASILSVPWKKGTALKSQKGKTVKVLSASKRQFLIDQLEGGDSLTLVWKMKVTKSAEDISDLKNSVSVEGRNRDGSSLKKTALMKDKDAVTVDEKTNHKSAGMNDTNGPSGRQSSGARTGDDTRIGWIVLLFGISFIGILLGIRQYRREKRT